MEGGGTRWRTEFRVEGGNRFETKLGITSAVWEICIGRLTEDVRAEEVKVGAAGV